MNALSALKNFLFPSVVSALRGATHSRCQHDTQQVSTAARAVMLRARRGVGLLGVVGVVGSIGLLATMPARAAHDYPTLERVRFVQECMAEHKGGTFEMTSKCVCVVDALAQELSLDDFISLSTAQKATTIGGERGGYIRDSEALQDNIKRWRALQRKTKAACFINLDAR